MDQVLITVRFWAGARRAAGRADETLEAATLDDVRAALAARAELTGVMAVASLLVDGQQSAPDRQLAAGAVIDVLPPFAGG